MPFGIGTIREIRGITNSRHMAEIMTKLEKAPSWITALCAGIDSLDFKDSLDRFTSDAELIFGTETSVGAEAIRKFFFKIDGPLVTKHEIFEVWSGSGRTYVMGQAELAQKSQPDQKKMDPFQWMFYHDPANNDLLRKWRVTAGPVNTDAVL